ncbi:MAG TPA: hypothetical protein VLU23_07020 [Pseudolabrys sp.]|nr:hypothetical protein [Pseudolabrys sp.]
MAENLPEWSRDTADDALRRQLGITNVGQQRDRRQHRDEKNGSPAHGRIPKALSQIERWL